jgi:small subunit ribosomal protein S7
MARGKNIPKRKIPADPYYNSELVSKFINAVMTQGKKTVAQKNVYGAFDILKEKRKENPLKLFEQAIDTVKPQLEIRSRRVGGANYQIPMPVKTHRQNALAFRWLINAAKARKGKSMQENLAMELSDILDGTGASLKKKEEVHRMAEANKAFAHFARFAR